MKLQHMLRYIISSIALLMFSIAAAQNDTEATTAKDSVPAKDNYGLRIGLDLSKPIRMLIEKDYRGFEVVGDFRLTKRFYLAAELGNEKKTVDDDQQNFTTEGSYIKLGFDFNAYKNWLGMENVIHAGLRYGYSTHKQTLNSYRIYQNNQLLETEESLLITDNPREFSSLNAHWIEVVAGVKVKVYNNIYLGFSLRLNRLLSAKDPENFENLFIPGFNKVTSDSNIGAGFNYTVTYNIPIYKKEKVKKEAEEENEE